jgi:hypothetical protein
MRYLAGKFNCRGAKVDVALEALEQARLAMERR